MQLSIWCNNNFKHFKCCYHDANDMCKFYAGFKKMLTRAYHETFVTVAETEKGCHGNDNDSGATATFRFR